MIGRLGIRRSLPAAVVLALVTMPAPGHAQTEGKISVGGSVTLVSPTDDDVERAIGVGPLVRLNPRKGWGPAGALNWFRADLRHPAAEDAPFARLRVRPLMGGAGYTLGSTRTLVTLSVVAGPSFNSADFDDDYVAPLAGDTDIEADISFAVRPGVSVTHSLARRVGLTAFAGYLFNRPEVTYRVGALEISDRWRADSVVLSVGVVYSLF